MYKQKVKHIMFEYERNMEALREEGAAGLKLLEKEFLMVEADMRKNQRVLKVCWS